MKINGLVLKRIILPIIQTTINVYKFDTINALRGEEMSKKNKSYTTEFKFKVALDAIRGELTFN